MTVGGVPRRVKASTGSGVGAADSRRRDRASAARGGGVPERVEQAAQGGLVQRGLPDRRMGRTTTSGCGLSSAVRGTTPIPSPAATNACVVG
jgi:hypothetical protein